MKIQLEIEIDFNNHNAKVEGDSIGIYELEEELLNCGIVYDAVRGNIDPVEKSLLKVTDPKYHKLLYRDEYPDPVPHKGQTIAEFLDQNDL